MYALRHLEASKVAITTNFQPILTGVLSWVFFRERFTPGFIIGAVLVLAGVTWVETRRESATRAADRASRAALAKPAEGGGA